MTHPGYWFLVLLLLAAIYVVQRVTSPVPEEMQSSTVPEWRYRDGE